MTPLAAMPLRVPNWPAPDPRVRGQVALFNVTTTLTVATGILCLYLVLFALILGVAELLIGPDVFASALGHPAATMPLYPPMMENTFV